MAHVEPPHEDSRSLYIGNLHQKVTDEDLEAVFSPIGDLQSCKVIRDKVYNKSAGYAFVDFATHEAATKALAAFNNHSLHGKELKLNWAFSCSHREDTSAHFHVFVGDLAPEVSNELLYQAFSKFGSLSDARVMWDQSTGRSRGYGFVAFRNQPDADKAIAEMNGSWVGSRAIRCNWANQRAAGRGGGGGESRQLSGGRGGGRKHNSMANLSVDEVIALTTPSNTTVYVGNLASSITEEDLRGMFESFGEVEEYRTQLDKGFGFVRYRTQVEAAKAIIGAGGAELGGSTIRVSWGKERRAKAPVMYPYSPYANNLVYSQPYSNYQPFYPGDVPQFYSYDMAAMGGGYPYAQPMVIGPPGAPVLPSQQPGMLATGEVVPDQLPPHVLAQHQLQQQMMIQQMHHPHMVPIAHPYGAPDSPVLHPGMMPPPPHEFRMEMLSPNGDDASDSNQTPEREESLSEEAIEEEELLRQQHIQQQQQRIQQFQQQQLQMAMQAQLHAPLSPILQPGSPQFHVQPLMYQPQPPPPLQSHLQPNQPQQSPLEGQDQEMLLYQQAQIHQMQQHYQQQHLQLQQHHHQQQHEQQLQLQQQMSDCQQSSDDQEAQGDEQLSSTAAVTPADHAEDRTKEARQDKSPNTSSPSTGGKKKNRRGRGRGKPAQQQQQQQQQGLHSS